MADDWRIPHKPYDLRERLFQFACIVVRVVEFLHTRGPVAKALSYQLLKCGTSAGANYEESDDGSSDRDTLAKRKMRATSSPASWRPSCAKVDGEPKKLRTHLGSWELEIGS